MKHSRTLKLFVAAGAGLLAASTQATELKIDEAGATLSDIFKFSNGTWDNVVENKTTPVSGQEVFTFEADLKNGDLGSGSSGIQILDAGLSISDVLTATWTLVPETRGSHDHFIITLYSGGGFPSLLPTDTTPEAVGMAKYLKVGSAPSDVNIFVNSPEDGVINPHGVPDGGMTLALLGSALSAIGLIRRKLS
jgi:hypothetical protein